MLHYIFNYIGTQQQLINTNENISDTWYLLHIAAVQSLISSLNLKFMFMCTSKKSRLQTLYKNNTSEIYMTQN